jgi:hypothetical protein
MSIYLPASVAAVIGPLLRIVLFCPAPCRDVAATTLRHTGSAEVAAAFCTKVQEAELAGGFPATPFTALSHGSSPFRRGASALSAAVEGQKVTGGFGEFARRNAIVGILLKPLDAGNDLIEPSEFWSRHGAGPCV